MSTVETDTTLELAVVHLDLLVDAVLAAAELAVPLDGDLAPLDEQLDVLAAHAGQLEAHDDLAVELLEVDVGERHEADPRLIALAARHAGVLEDAQHVLVCLLVVHGCDSFDRPRASGDAARARDPCCCCLFPRARPR